MSFNDVIEYRANGIRLPPDKGLEKFDRDIEEWIAENRRYIVLKWNAIRPSNCPVGAM